MIVPKSFCSILDDVVVAETWPVVIEESEFVRWEDVCCRLSVKFCPDFCQTFLEKVCEALVNATVTVLSDVNSLSKRDLTVAGYVFKVTTHVVDDERRARLRVILQSKDWIGVLTTEGIGFRRQQEWEDLKVVEYWCCGKWEGSAGGDYIYQSILSVILRRSTQPRGEAGRPRHEFMQPRRATAWPRPQTVGSRERAGLGAVKL